LEEVVGAGAGDSEGETDSGDDGIIGGGYGIG